MKPPSEAKAQPGTRRYHTRGRNGCLTCKQRHMRCDGAQPICGPCARLGKACEFASIDPPLRERRALPLPGQQTPWAVCLDKPRGPHPSPPVMLVIDANPIDPFDCLPLQMPFKSKELLHYFFQQNHELTYKKQKKDDILPSMLHSADALRDTLLVADLHYLWNARDFRRFQATGLFHKGEVIQTLNKRLQGLHLKDLSTIVKHIATLTFLETAFGYVTTAQSHLDGLLGVLELYSPLNDVPNVQTGFEDEMTHRYLILSCDFIESMRKKMQDYKGREDEAGRPPDPSESVPPVFKWLPGLDVASVSTYLKVMAMSPFLLTPRPLTNKFRHINAKPLLNYLRSLNTIVSSSDSEDSGNDPEQSGKTSSIERLITGLRVTYISSHLASQAEDPRGSSFGENTTSWCGITIASGMYLRHVLGVWDQAEPVLFRRWMIILARDLDQNRWKYESSRANLWVWEHFVAAYSFAANESQNCVKDLEMTRRYFNRAIQKWGLEQDVVTWEDAHQRLQDVAWPACHNESLARSVWEGAVGLASDET